MATLNDIKNKIFALIDEYDKNGVTNNDTVKDALKQIPIWADDAQRDLLSLSRYSKSYDLVHTKSGQDYNKAYDLGSLISDFDGINYIVDTKNGYNKTGWTIENTTLYVSNSYETTYRIVYTPIITQMTDMTSVFTIQGNVIYDTIPYYVAAMLLLRTDANISNFLMQRYNENKKLLLQKTKAVEEPIIDVYA